jgi:hypothetical protein
MAIVYKILCEVKLLHEYYLTGSQGQSVFDETLQQDRLAFLYNNFSRGMPSISSDMDFVAPASQQQLFENYHLRIVPSYSGFKLAVRCRPQQLGDGTTVYAPFVALPDNLEIPVLLEAKTNILAFSSQLMGSPVRAGYFFTNESFPGARTFPFLSGAVPAFNGAKTYQQGELAAFGASIRMFLNNGAADPWRTLNGSGYVTDADRLLAPLRLQYTFPAGAPITAAGFALQDNNDNTIKEITITNANAIRSVWLDFHTPDEKVRTISNSAISGQHLYKLIVTANNGYTHTLDIVFAADNLKINNYMGLICLKPKVAAAAFNLLDDAGLLHTRILPDGSRVPPPVFELWWKSRLVFWHYRNNERRKLKLMADTQDLLMNDNGVLLSKEPIPLSYGAVMLQKPDNSFQFLPNPAPGIPVRAGNNRQYVEIMVPNSKFFPLDE